MMRGVSTWAVAVRVPHELAAANGVRQRRRQRRSPPRRGGRDRAGGGGHHGGGRGPGVGQRRRAAPTARSRSGRSRSTRESFESAMKKRRLYRLPIVRGVVALGESLKIGMKALGISANAQLDEPDEEISGKTWGFTIFLSLVVRDRPLLRPAGHGRELLEGRRRQLGRASSCVEKLIRISIFLGYLWAHLAHQGPAARVRVPRRRAQGDLLLRGRRAARARARAALLAPAHALRHQLPADRDDHRACSCSPRSGGPTCTG